MSKNNKIKKDKVVFLPKVSVIIRNQNKFSLSSECIKSLKKLTYPNFNIIVVDDGSIDDSPDRLKKAFPYIILIRNRKYLGYCKANNIGIREAIEKGAEYMFLLNNDTKDFSQNYLEEVIKVFEKDGKIGLVGSKVLDFKGNIIWGGEDHKKLGVARNTPDCGFIIRSELFKEIGLLDESLFRYFEDLDFIIRLRKAGYKTIFVPSVKFAHMVGGTTSQVGFVFHYYRVRNIFLFLKKHGAEMSLLSKVKNIIQLMIVHIKIVISCLVHCKIKDLIRVVGAIFRGFSAGLFLFYKK